MSVIVFAAVPKRRQLIKQTALTSLTSAARRPVSSDDQMKECRAVSGANWKNVAGETRRKQTRRIWMLRYVTATQFRRKGRPRMWYWVESIQVTE